MIQVIEKYVDNNQYKYEKVFELKNNYVNLANGDLVQQDTLTWYQVDRQLVDKNCKRYVIVTLMNDMPDSFSKLINGTE